jgi:hypothetical protein
MNTMRVAQLQHDRGSLQAPSVAGCWLLRCTICAWSVAGRILDVHRVDVLGCVKVVSEVQHDVDVAQRLGELMLRRMSARSASVMNMQRYVLTASVSAQWCRDARC